MSRTSGIDARQIVQALASFGYLDQLTREIVAPAVADAVAATVNENRLALRKTIVEQIRRRERERVKDWLEDHGHEIAGWGFLQELIDGMPEVM